jgi:hypothetical protein
MQSEITPCVNSCDGKSLQVVASFLARTSC